MHRQKKTPLYYWCTLHYYVGSFPSVVAVSTVVGAVVVAAVAAVVVISVVAVFVCRSLSPSPNNNSYGYCVQKA